VAAGGWVLISGAIAATGMMPDYWMRGTGAAQLAAELRNDPALCGLALYDRPFHLLPGRDRLAGQSPLCAFHPADPLASDGLAVAAQKAAPAFNRILSRRDSATDLPVGFSQRDCAGVGGADVCIFTRSGGCDAAAAAPFVLNNVLVRVDR
jgi:phosphatidylinositol glycan class B